MRASSSQFGRSRRGNAIAEFGLAFPLLLAFLTGMFQLGYGFFLYNELQSAVRAGARFASVTDFQSDQGGTAFANQVKNMVVYGNPAGGTTPLAPGLTTGSVNVTWQTDAAGIPQTVTVNIFNYGFSVLGTSFRFTNKPQSVFIFLGQFVG